MASNKKLYPDTAKTCSNVDFQTSSEDVSNVFKVYDWYKEKYPNQENIINSLGYKPFLLNGKLYHILIKLDYEYDKQKMLHKLKELIDDMNQVEKDSLAENNLDFIYEEFKKGVSFYTKINFLQTNIEETRIDDEIVQLLAAGIFDINISLSAFKNPFYLDSQPIMFHAHQASEKFLKSLYAQHKLHEIKSSCQTVDTYVKNKNIGHNIISDELITQLKVAESNIIQIEHKIEDLHREVQNMTNIRYKDSGKTIENAIKCIDLMIEICGYVAESFVNIIRVKTVQL
ncbi:HEPN domain-containing protein [Anabaenopsis sp. FSS-46]|uniref:hypothetical protein n=1 Tax=Anabaenopsis sp. FSS-46 TaxID=2971766 RepID=UPI002473CB34|nr:hypothetical protein [Anabaenopsis sp. FSS-46]MDH6099178.1 HEPN domain-containing protein [Anabaenopsis sp. FSS-46]